VSALQKYPSAACAAEGARGTACQPSRRTRLVVLRRLGLDVGRPEPLELGVP
jgi:hypothetical protein